MPGLGALAHYHEQNRALGRHHWGPIEKFLGSDLWAKAHVRRSRGAVLLEGGWVGARGGLGEDTEHWMRNGQ